MNQKLPYGAFDPAHLTTPKVRDAYHGLKSAEKGTRLVANSLKVLGGLAIAATVATGVHAAQNEDVPANPVGLVAGAFSGLAAINAGRIKEGAANNYASSAAGLLNQEAIEAYGTSLEPAAPTPQTPVEDSIAAPDSQLK